MVVRDLAFVNGVDDLMQRGRAVCCDRVAVHGQILKAPLPVLAAVGGDRRSLLGAVPVKGDRDIAGTEIDTDLIVYPLLLAVDTGLDQLVGDGVVAVRRGRRIEHTGHRRAAGTVSAHSLDRKGIVFLDFHLVVFSRKMRVPSTSTQGPRSVSFM